MWNRDSAVKKEPVAPEPVSPFPAQAAQPASPAAAGQPAERRVVAWVGKSVIFRGDLISSEDMTIDGRIEGTIDVRDHHLTIGPNGKVAADIVAHSITVFGEVTGSLTSRDKAEIRVGATVEADLSCRTLAIQEGAYFRGTVTMSEKPAVTEKTEKSDKSDKKEAAKNDSHTAAPTVPMPIAASAAR